MTHDVKEAIKGWLFLLLVVGIIGGIGLVVVHDLRVMQPRRNRALYEAWMKATGNEHELTLEEWMRLERADLLPDTKKDDKGLL